MNLRQKAREALLWGAGFRILRDLTQFGLMLVLVRLLSPEDYGRYGLVTSIIGFAGLLSARTFLAHILQVQRDEEVRAQDHFTAGLMLQGALFLATNLLALGLRLSDTYRPVSSLLHVASLIFLVELPGEFHSKIIERGMDFRRLRLLNIAGIGLSAACALVLAVAGAGVYALVIPPLLLPVPFGIDLFLRSRFRPTLTFDRHRYLPAWRFGLARAASGGMNGTRDLAQSSLLVRFFGYGALGLFGRAVGVGNVACASLAWQFVSYVYPLLSRQEPASPTFRRGGDLLLRGVLWFALPMVVGLGLHASAVVRILYGERWLAVVPLLPAALFENAVRAGAMTCYMILLAANRYRHCLAQDALMLVLALVALAVARAGGAARYLVMLGSAEALGGMLMLTWALRQRLLSAGGLVTAFVPATVGVAAGLLAALGVRAAAPALPEFAAIATTGTAFAALYLLAIRLCFRGQLAELLAYVPGGSAACRLLALPGDGGREKGEGV